MAESTNWAYSYCCHWEKNQSLTIESVTEFLVGMNIQVEMITTARRMRCIVKIKSENDYDVLYDLLVGKTTT
jgi:hypothetical protein